MGLTSIKLAEPTPYTVPGSGVREQGGAWHAWLFPWWSSHGQCR